MAYNPFNIFRRNQKVLFAVLTVFIMIMFTLSSGVAGGDFFETFSRWLGAKSARGEVVCKIDGSKVTAGELDGGPRSLRGQRLMANKFMSEAANETSRALASYLTDARPRLSKEGQDTVDEALGTFQTWQMIVQQFPQAAQGFVSRLPAQAKALTERVDSPNARGEDKDAARAAQVLILLFHRELTTGGKHYFLNAPNRNQEDLIEFLLWQKKADQMGIKFSRDDVKRLIQSEFAGMFKSDVNVRNALKNMQGFSLDSCYAAIGEEFRVRAAQTAVLGYVGRLGSAPVYATPYEAYEYYRDQCSPSTYELLAVPVAAFVGKVPGEPTDAEITEMFKKGENQEPNPRSESPGFKSPRKIALAFFGVTGEEQYYKKLAEEQIKVGEVMAKMSGVFTVPVPGAGAGWNAAAAGPLTLKEPAVDAAYNAYKNLFEYHRDKNYEKSALAPKSKFSSWEQDDPLLPTSAVKPGTVAATMGAFVGQAAGFGNPAAAVTLSSVGPLAYEIRDRVKVGVPYALSAMPTPALLQSAVGGIAQFQGNLPQPLSIQAMRPDLIKEAIPKRAKVLAFGTRPDPTDPRGKGEKGDLDKFADELDKMSEKGKPKDPAAVQKYITEFAAARGLTISKSVEARDEWTLEDDAGLAALVGAHQRSLRSAGNADQFSPFGRAFFWEDRFDMASRGMRREATADTFKAFKFPPQDDTDFSGTTTRYMVWRTEDVSPIKRNVISARADVIAAWKRIKARDLAKQRAEEIAADVRDKGGADPGRALTDHYFTMLRDVNDPKVIERVKKFSIERVAPLTPGPGQLQPFGLTETANLPYPTREFVTALVENRDKPLKTVIVLPDAPKDTYYVAVLVNRTLKQPSEFKTEAYGQAGTARGIVGTHRAEATRKARESVVALLKQEFKFEATDEQKKKLEENTKTGSRDD
jgi:hypothetical protein